MGSVNDIGMMIAFYIMMKAVSLLSKKEEPNAAKNLAIICIMATALFLLSWIITTFNIISSLLK